MCSTCSAGKSARVGEATTTTVDDNNWDNMRFGPAMLWQRMVEGPFMERKTAEKRKPPFSMLRFIFVYIVSHYFLLLLLFRFVVLQIGLCNENDHGYTILSCMLSFRCHFYFLNNFRDMKQNLCEFIKREMQ